MIDTEGSLAGSGRTEPLRTDTDYLTMRLAGLDLASSWLKLNKEGALITDRQVFLVDGVQ